MKTFFTILALASSLFLAPNQSTHALGLSCQGVAVSAKTINQALMSLSNSIREANSPLFRKAHANLKALGLSNPVDTYLQGAAVEFEKRAQLLLNYEASGFDASVALAISQRTGSHDICVPGYPCGAGSSGNANNCNACGYEEVTPRTNPRTCIYSCTMCCAHYRNPAGCATSCAASDPC